ncbi:unnamed protein product [Ectocarpus sp. 6 AP-2014]
MSGVRKSSNIISVSVPPQTTPRFVGFTTTWQRQIYNRAIQRPDIMEKTKHRTEARTSGVQHRHAHGSFIVRALVLNGAHHQAHLKKSNAATPGHSRTLELKSAHPTNRFD